MDREAMKEVEYESRISALEMQVRRLNLCVLLLALGLGSIGMRLIVALRQEGNWQAQSATWEASAEQRLQNAQAWEVYWKNQEQTTMPERQK
jgi:hypothetical protein